MTAFDSGVEKRSRTDSNLTESTVSPTSSKSSSSACVSPPGFFATSPRDFEYQVTLHKSKDSRLGIRLDRFTLELIVVYGDGLVSKWNQAHPENVMKSGDRIVEVNGVRATPERLYGNLERNSVLDLILVRPKPKEPVIRELEDEIRKELAEESNPFHLPRYTRGTEAKLNHYAGEVDNYGGLGRGFLAIFSSWGHATTSTSGHVQNGLLTLPIEHRAHP